MKKLTSLFLALSAFAIVAVSCSKDSSTPSAATAVSGKWYYDTTLTTVNGTPNGQALPYNYSQCTGKKSYLDFQVGGVLAEGDISDCTLHNYTDHWTQNGTALNTVLDTGDPINYTVVSVTSTNMVLRNYLSPDQKTYTDYSFTRQ